MKRKASRQREMVAFQGERGAFSEEAAHRLLGPAIEVLPCPRFEDVFRSLDRKTVQAAVIPIENTLHGSVHENYDHLLHFNLPIVGETNVRIVHNLIAVPGVGFGKIRRVFSHPVALNQCLDFFAANPQASPIGPPPMIRISNVSIRRNYELSVTDCRLSMTLNHSDLRGTRRSG